MSTVDFLFYFLFKLIIQSTLKYHNKNIYSKLGVKTRKELLQYIELMRNAEH